MFFGYLYGDLDKISRTSQYTKDSKRKGEDTLADLTAVNPSFGVNDFNEVKYYEADETIVRDLLLLLFGKPGFYPSIPYLGMNIQTLLYTLEDDMDTSQLKAKLAVQCNDFLGLITSGELDIYTLHYNGNPMLVFRLPVVREKASDLILGITVLENGEMQFNFVFNDDDVQEV